MVIRGAPCYKSECTFAITQQLNILFKMALYIYIYLFFNFMGKVPKSAFLRTMGFWLDFFSVTLQFSRFYTDCEIRATELLENQF